MAQAEGTGAPATAGSGGGVLSGLLDQLIDAHDQVYDLVSSALTGGDRGHAGAGAADESVSTGTSDVPIYDGTPEEMLSAEDLDELSEGGMKSPLEGMAEQVMGDIFSSQVGPQTTMEHLQAFSAAINWREPLIVGLIAFQLIMFLATLAVIRRGGTATRFGLLLLIAIIVRSAEKLNEYCGGRWEDIATQNYFDTNGVFVLLFVAVPLLGDCVLMLISFIREASSLLVEVKTMEIEQKKKQKQKQTQGSTGSNRKDGEGGKRGKRSKKDD